jgi:hypothetical protein
MPAITTIIGTTTGVCSEGVVTSQARLMIERLRVKGSCMRHVAQLG